MRDASVVLVLLRQFRKVLLTGKRGIRPYLQDVVVVRALGDSDLLGDGQRVRKVLIGDVMQLLTVICERRKAERYSRGPLSDYSKKKLEHLGMTREWPLERGLMSRKE